MKAAIVGENLGKLESIVGWDDIEYLIFACSWIYHEEIDESGVGGGFIVWLRWERRIFYVVGENEVIVSGDSIWDGHV